MFLVCLFNDAACDSFCDSLKELLLPWVLLIRFWQSNRLKENCNRLLDCRPCVKVTLSLKCRSPHIG